MVFRRRLCRCTSNWDGFLRLGLTIPILEFIATHNYSSSGMGWNSLQNNLVSLKFMLLPIWSPAGKFWPLLPMCNLLPVFCCSGSLKS